MNNEARPGKRRSIICTGLLAVMAGAVAALFVGNAAAEPIASGQAAPVAEQSLEFAIPAGDLVEALTQFAAKTDLELVYDADLLAGKKTRGLAGSYTPAQALYVLLIDAGQTFRFAASDRVIIEAIAANTDADDAVLLAPSIALAARPTGVTIDKTSTGRALVGRGAIASLDQGAGDPTDAFTQLPNLEFSRSQYRVTKDSEQSLLPQEISISGGDIYSNLLTFDGIQTKSYIYNVTDNNPANFDALGISTTHIVQLDSNLLEQIAVQDSNVSAKYTGFTGGVVEFKTRDPRDTAGASFSATYAGDSLTHYLVGVDEAVDRAKFPEPEFERYKLRGVVDWPFSDRLSSMLALSLRQSQIVRPISPDYTIYQNPSTETASRSMQLLGKLKYNLSGEDTLLLNTNITPYKSEFTRGNVFGDRQSTDGISYVNSLEWRRERGNFSSNLKAIYSEADMKRDAPNTFLRWTNTAYRNSRPRQPQTDFCNRRLCATGGFGDIQSQQQTLGLDAAFSYYFAKNDLNFGFRWYRDEVESKRFDTNYIYAFASSRQGSRRNIICVDPGDVACIGGQQVITRRNVLSAYDIGVNINAVDGYTELEGFIPLDGLINKFRYRAGLNITYEDYLKNTDIAPRLSLGLDVGNAWALDIGANRYYTRNLLSYALRDGKPSPFLENRRFERNGRDYRYQNDWVLYSQSARTKYSDANLKTPHSDELTFAITYSDADGLGTLRLKGIYRDNKDRIARNLEQRQLTRVLRGREVTYNQRFYTPTNGGRSSYRGLSLEWNKSLDNHFLSLVATLSKTESSNLDYFDQSEDGSEQVAYLANPEGAARLDDAAFAATLTTVDALSLRRQDFSTPFILSGFWKANWLGGKLVTSIDGRFIPGWKDIVNTGRGRRYRGVRYDIYGDVERRNRLRFNAEMSYRLDLSSVPVTLGARVNNLFNHSSRTATARNPYEKGRSFIFSIEVPFD